MKSLSGFVGGGPAGWGNASSAIAGLTPSNPASANPHNNVRMRILPWSFGRAPLAVFARPARALLERAVGKSQTVLGSPQIGPPVHRANAAGQMGDRR